MRREHLQGQCVAFIGDFGIMEYRKIESHKSSAKTERENRTYRIESHKAEREKKNRTRKPNYRRTKSSAKAECIWTASHMRNCFQVRRCLHRAWAERCSPVGRSGAPRAKATTSLSTHTCVQRWCLQRRKSAISPRLSPPAICRRMGASHGAL